MITVLSTPSWITSDNYINTGKTIYVSDSNLDTLISGNETDQPGVVHFWR